jgi:two-component sensor histidine kinase
LLPPDHDDETRPVVEIPPAPPRSPAAEHGLHDRLRQQGLLSALGVTALRGVPLQDLLDEAVRVCADGLNAELCKVLEYQSQESRLLMKAGFGWQEGLVGVASVGADMASPSGYALHTGKPVISNHLENEERFRTPELLLVHGVRRAINVILQGDGTPYGVLEVDSRSPGEFSEADITFLQGAANILGMAIERQRREGALKAALDYHKVLVNEINHRVKNSLQLVAAMIQLRAGSGGDPANILQEASSRISVIAQAHARLTGSQDITHIDLAVYLNDICKDVEDQFFDCDLEFSAPNAVVMPTDRAVRVALILNELVMNACKHASRSMATVRVWVGLEQRGPDRLSLSVRDDGEGLPPGFDLATARTMGMRVLTALIEQMGAELRVSRPSAGGTEFVLDCPIRAQQE